MGRGSSDDDSDVSLTDYLPNKNTVTRRCSRSSTTIPSRREFLIGELRSPHHKTLHQCLRQNLQDRFIFLLKSGAGLMKQNKWGETVIKVILENKNFVALYYTMEYSTWLTPQRIDKHKILSLAMHYDSRGFATFLINKGANIYDNSLINLRLNNSRTNSSAANYLIQQMIKNECAVVKDLHENDKKSWLYKDYLCNDVFDIIMSYLQA